VPIESESLYHRVDIQVWFEETVIGEADDRFVRFGCDSAASRNNINALQYYGERIENHPEWLPPLFARAIGRRATEAALYLLHAMQRAKVSVTPDFINQRFEESISNPRTEAMRQLFANCGHAINAPFRGMTPLQVVPGGLA
jgi:hypothetical protein